MGNAHPQDWARSKVKKLRAYTSGDVARFTRLARDAFFPGLPVAALLGFAANGDKYNTTGWLVGDESERQDAIRKGRRPFIKGDPRKGYGGIGTDDLHELAYFGVEAGHCPTPVATDPDCPWVVLARDPAVVAVLGREGVTGAKWYGATEDQCVIGVANLKRHHRAIRKAVDPRLSWAEDALITLWQWALTSMSWSAGTGRAAAHVNKYVEALLAVAETERKGLFAELAGKIDDDGSRHRQDEYTALREAQKDEAAIRAIDFTGEGDAARAFLDDRLGEDRRAAVYKRLVETT